MKLNKRQFNKLTGFLGYGNPKAKVWFLGMEEGLDSTIEQDKEKLYEYLSERAKFRKIMDCKIAHYKLNIADFHTDEKSKIQKTWSPMCQLMLASHELNANRESRRAYQSAFLGRSHGDTFLCELLPLPRSTTNTWPYENVVEDNVLGAIKSYATYRNDILPTRIKLLQRLWSKSEPQVVVCYGKVYWHHYKNIFNDVNMPAAGDWILQRNESIEIRHFESSTVILTPHFTRITNESRRALESHFRDALLHRQFPAMHE